MIAERTTKKTPEEVEAEHMQAFDPALGPLYHALYNEVVWVNAKWREYRKLYAKSVERIELLNETAGFLFRVVEDVLWDDILLHITRLTERKKGTLTLRRLLKVIEDEKLAAEVERLVKSAESCTTFVQDWRNQHIAHRNLELALAKAEPLPGVSRQHVEDALSAISAVMNLVYGRYVGGEVGFEHVIVDGDADALVYQLSVAHWTEKRKLDRLQSGKQIPEDFESPPAV